MQSWTFSITVDYIIYYSYFLLCIAAPKFAKFVWHNWQNVTAENLGLEDSQTLKHPMPGKYSEIDPGILNNRIETIPLYEMELVRGR